MKKSLQRILEDEKNNIEKNNIEKYYINDLDEKNIVNYYNDFSGYSIEDDLRGAREILKTSTKWPPNELIDSDLEQREKELKKKEKKLKKEQDDFKVEQEKLEAERKKIAEEKASIEKERADLDERRKKIEDDEFKKSELNELGDFPT